jgi:hypothetical protein
MRIIIEFSSLSTPPKDSPSHCIRKSISRFRKSLARGSGHFPERHVLSADRRSLGTIYHDRQFTALFPTRGQPAEALACLALITVLQFVEGLSDRQAADAVRRRIDWKYVLG